MRSFQINLAGDEDVATILTRAQDAAGDVGIEFTGDDCKGTFEGFAHGTYQVEGRTLTIEVTKKPKLLPWPILERELRGVFT